MSMQVQRESQPLNESIFEGQKKRIRVRLSFFLSLLLSLLFLSNFAFGQANSSFIRTSGPIGSTVTITGTDSIGASAVSLSCKVVTTFTLSNCNVCQYKALRSSKEFNRFCEIYTKFLLSDNLRAI